MHTPDARARRVERVFAAGGAPPEDDRERRYYDYLSRTSALGANTPYEPDPASPDPDPTMCEAVDLHNGPTRHVLDALLLVNAPVDRVCDALLLRREVYDLYAALWFDTSAFRNGFVRRHYANNVPRDETDEWRAYQLVLTEGYEALLGVYRIGPPPPIDPKDVTARMTYELASRALAHRGRPLTSMTARTALGLARSAIAGSTALAQITPSNELNAKQLLKIELLGGQYTVRANESPVPLTELVRTGPVEPTAAPTPNSADPKLSP